MAFVQQSLLEQRKEPTEQRARKQRIALLIRHLKQQWKPLRQA
jgi:hypothetical protein